MGLTLDFSAVLERWPILVDGAMLTLQLALIATVFGAILGTLCAVGRGSRNRFIVGLCSAYVDAVRNTPLLVQIFLVYFGLASLGLKLSAFTVAATALTINVGAYTTEIMRAGIDAIPVGQIEAAQGLPLGLADKLFLSLENADEFEKETRLFGATDRTATATYHLRPFGRPQIEVYFGGSLAAELEAAGERAFFDFALSELTRLLGSAFAQRVKPIHVHRWGSDPFARGSYSYARPGMADCRMALAAPVDNRLFFAGEACSSGDFSTAHGGWITGVAAAEQVIAARPRR